MKFKKIVSISAGLAVAASLALSLSAFAQTTTPPNPNPSFRGHAGSTSRAFGNGSGAQGMNREAGMLNRGVFGTVSAINGNSITVTGRQGFGSTTQAIVYTVDATNATVRKGNATSTVSAIAVGDMISAQGTVTGTNVVAKVIIDGIMNRPGGPRTASSTQAIMGNGQPVIAGTVSAANGDSLTVTTASNVTYTIDATNAKVLQGENASTVASIAVGNKVLVQGVVNGTSITASTIIDQNPMANHGQDNPGSNASTSKPKSSGMFGAIGQFFMHIFGF